MMKALSSPNKGSMGVSFGEAELIHIEKKGQTHS